VALNEGVAKNALKIISHNKDTKNIQRMASQREIASLKS
jgi:hypothetical protein